MDQQQLIKSAAEKMALIALDDVLMPIAKEMIEQSENKWDDMILPFLDQVREKLAEAIDQIDGEVG